MRALLVPVDADVLAVPLTEVHEVLPLPEVTPLPYRAGRRHRRHHPARRAGRGPRHRAPPRPHRCRRHPPAASLDADGRKVALTATGSPGLAELGEEVPGGPERPGTWCRAGDLVVLRVDPARLVAVLTRGVPVPRRAAS